MKDKKESERVTIRIGDEIVQAVDSYAFTKFNKRNRTAVCLEALVYFLRENGYLPSAQIPVKKTAAPVAASLCSPSIVKSHHDNTARKRQTNVIEHSSEPTGRAAEAHRLHSSKPFKTSSRKSSSNS